jgi:hypothetical protein
MFNEPFALNRELETLCTVCFCKRVPLGDCDLSANMNFEPETNRQ